MILPNLAEELNEQMLRDCAAQRRSQTVAYYERNYRELEGDVFSASDMAKYWPRRSNEKIESYDERVKIWTELPRIIVNRLVASILSGDVKREWIPISDADKTHAERANELEELTNESNDWETKAQQVYYYALGIGEVALWPEFRKFNKVTGEAYSVAGGSGVPIWTYWFPWFVEPITLQDYAEEIIGAVKIIFCDGQISQPYVAQTIRGNKQKVITQAYLAPSFDRFTGGMVNPGFYRNWENGIEVFDGENNLWHDKNLFECNPVAFFRGPDPDETQYRGKCYVDRFRNLAVQHSRLISTIGQAIEVLPNIWTYEGDQKVIDKIIIRHGEVVQVPAGAKFQQAGRELNLSEDWKLAQYLEKTISILGCIPPEVWDTLGSAGKVESGVALRLTMQPMAEAVQLIRKHMASAEKHKMRSTVQMFNFYNDNRIDLTKIRPECTYKQNVIPVDEAVEILNDLALFAANAKSLPDLVMKYNSQITTREQAEKFIQEIQAAKPKPEVAPSLRVRDRNAGQTTQ